MKKIIHLIKGLEGGLDNISKQIFLYLKFKKFEQEILFFYEQGNKIYKEFNKKKLYHLDYKKEVIFVNLFNSIKELNQVDIIHIHHTKTWILFTPLIFYKNKIIYSFHINFGSDIKKSFLEKFLITMIINYCSLFSKKLIFLNNAQKENIKNYVLFKNLLDQKSVIINNFIKKNRILKNKKNFNNNIIFVGRYTKIKGFEDLIKLAEIRRDFNFYLAGDNNYISNLSNLKNIGKIDNSKIFKEYDKASILLLPSYSESWGLVILEAMSRGLVVLTSNIPTICEYFEDGRNGFLFTPGDIEKMNKILVYLKNNPKEIERISKNNLKDIWKFTAEKQVPKYIKVYEEVLKENERKNKE